MQVEKQINEFFFILSGDQSTYYFYPGHEEGHLMIEKRVKSRHGNMHSRRFRITNKEKVRAAHMAVRAYWGGDPRC